MNLDESSADAGAVAGPGAGAGGSRVRRRPGVTDHVTELFHEEIRSGRWAVGERIPVESALVQWTGAGRNAVREAVQSLVQSGLVRREQGRGTFVIARSQLAQTLSRSISHGLRRDGLELRSALDSSAAALAAVRRTAADITRLQRLLAERAASWEAPDAAGAGAGDADAVSTPDLDRRIRADLALHRAIVEATHNALYLELYEGLTAVFEEVQRADVEGDIDPHAEHHRRLVEAIVAGDPEAARRQIEALIDPLLEDS
ncbi:FCD domain-containing protein [Herbiconiux sp. CPCC 203407]|uniref:FCD domain-containing protein n=1 Tax=Herbiconiux oxytropis TaxID=2970915 RepID=A0AA42BVX3_9MICO|nr:FCD domain-containing protein [Herbiconiux oxytropis]MCS5720610.1 FCD domain-containing protein [Herbiconiux oxytropis]MCS5725063.1 FCD domain-containing protein [Herbiconiux oxytropis]